MGWCVIVLLPRVLPWAYEADTLLGYLLYFSTTISKFPLWFTYRTVFLLQPTVGFHFRETGERDGFDTQGVTLGLRGGFPFRESTVLTHNSIIQQPFFALLCILPTPNLFEDAV